LPKTGALRDADPRRRPADYKRDREDPAASASSADPRSDPRSARDERENVGGSGGVGSTSSSTGGGVGGGGGYRDGAMERRDSRERVNEPTRARTPPRSDEHSRGVKRSVAAEPSESSRDDKKMRDWSHPSVSAADSEDAAGGGSAADAVESSSILTGWDATNNPCQLGLKNAVTDVNLQPICGNGALLPLIPRLSTYQFRKRLRLSDLDETLTGIGGALGDVCSVSSVIASGQSLRIVEETFTRCVCVCVCTRCVTENSTLLRTHMHACARTRKHGAWTHPHARARARAHTHPPTHTHTLTLTYIYTHTRARALYARPSSPQLTHPIIHHRHTATARTPSNHKVSAGEEQRVGARGPCARVDVHIRSSRWS
jgi:hypothetical protein